MYYEYFHTTKSAGVGRWIEAKCAHCGKAFERTAEHAYKENAGRSGKFRYYCSYRCLRAARAERERRRKQAREG